MTYFTLYNRLYVPPPHYSELELFLFYGRVIFHCIYVPQLLYPFFHWKTSRLIPHPDYCKQCCCEHCCPVGTSTTLQSNYSSITKKEPEASLHPRAHSESSEWCFDKANCYRHGQTELRMRKEIFPCPCPLPHLSWHLVLLLWLGLHKDSEHMKKK